MHALKLFSILFFSVLFGGPIFPLPSHATHTKMCCTCTNPCNPFCTCRGTNYHCPTCPGGHSAESPDFNISAGIGEVNIRAVRTADESERVAHLTKVGDCARRSFELRILGESAGNLNFMTFDHDDENLYEETVMRLAADSAGN
jgi:hypothetical protein